MTMAEVDEFLATALPPLTAADTALHNGDAGPRIGLWSRHDPVTLFGAVFTATGWREIEPIFETLAAQFSDCESFEYEVLAAGASSDLAYIVGIEHTRAAVGGSAPSAYELRVTTIFRREGSEWKVVHRHGDPVPGSVSTREQVGRIRSGPDGSR
jgi:ketosteroid isomerase-like protein